MSVKLAPSDEAFVSARVAGKLLRGSGAADETYLALFAWSETLLDPLTPRQMSSVSRGLLQRTRVADVLRQRRGNWSMLMEELRASPRLGGLVPLLPSLAPGEVPLGFPVRVPRGLRHALREHLSRQEIYCAVHWPLDHLPDGTFGPERDLSASLLTLPLDQRMGPPQVRRLVDALRSFPRELQ